jgi:hypothetical protein
MKNLTPVKNFIDIVIPHHHSFIEGVSWASINSTFWFFHDENLLVYHYRDHKRHTKTQYISLPYHVRKITYTIFQYTKDTSTLRLILHDEKLANQLIIKNTASKFGL